MAASSTLQKLLKNSQCPSRIILSSIQTPYLLNSPNPTQTLKHNNTTLIDENYPIKVASFLGPYKDAKFTHFDSLPFSSIHPFGLCSNPILATGLIQDLQNNDDDSGGMWADSVKKKRKKKMNKHKYKKLRKRLRKRT